MAGRKILDESNPKFNRYSHPDLVQRRLILKETLEVFSNVKPADYYHKLATANLERWKNEAKSTNVEEKVHVISGDWGEVTHRLTKEYGSCFAVLNMANAYIPGGGYMHRKRICSGALIATSTSLQQSMMILWINTNL